jgi:hypothetical protein
MSEEVVGHDEPQRDSHDTRRLLSWSAVKFIDRASPDFFKWSVIGLIGAFASAFIISHFILMDVNISANGNIVPGPSSQILLSPASGAVSFVLKSHGDSVVKGEAIMGILIDQLEMDAIQSLMKKLESHEGTSSSLHSIVDSRIKSPDILELIYRMERTKGKEADEARQITHSRLESYLSQHVIFAGSSGFVSHLYVQKDAIVTLNMPLAVISKEKYDFSTRIELSSSEAVKLRVGQRIVYHIPAYPSGTYGQFYGKVEALPELDTSVGQISGEDRYFARASILEPEGLSSELKQKIIFMPGMRFTSDVVIDRITVSEILRNIILRH